MKNVISLFMPFLFVVALCACTGGRSDSAAGNSGNAEAAKSTDGHTAQNSLDWDGVYKNDTMTVELNSDLSFMKTTPAEIRKGYFMWDTEGNVIALDNGDGGYTLLKVEENRLTNGDLILVKQ
ncbi:MAG: hypothetical protein IAC51_07550 [bacterium]|uniref:Lipoprotein n=1 Tax=Candidatus Aphodosoma intestinipullorum TaxID=2840674 RepID=A0A940IFB3_9BACT|nr:hypothetical protein [Candidatus Aphodosoma intestinipullorum]